MNKITIVILIILLLSACNASAPRKVVKSQNVPRYISPKILELNDSLEIVAWLNDTLFTSKDIVTRLHAEFDIFKIEQCKNPRINFFLCNPTNRDALVKWHGLSTLNYNPNLTDGLCILLGTRDTNYNNPNFTVFDIAPEKYYEILKAKDSLLFPDSLEIVGLYPEVDFRPGRYWVQLVYLNYLWSDTTLPIFIGEVWSDTLWFTVN